MTQVTSAGNTTNRHVTPLSTSDHVGPVVADPFDRADNTGIHLGMPLPAVLRLIGVMLPVLALVGAITGFAAFSYLNSQPPTYVSQARILVGSLQGPTDALRASASVASTYSDAIDSDGSMRRLAENAGLADISAEDMHDYVRVLTNDRSRILTIETEWETAEKAQQMASLLVADVQALESGTFRFDLPENVTADAQTEQLVREAVAKVQIVQEPSLPQEPEDTPNALVSALVGSVSAFVVFLVTLVWAQIVRSREQRRLAAFNGADTLGTITTKTFDNAEAGKVSGGKDASGSGITERVWLRIPAKTPRLLAIAECDSSGASALATARLALHASSRGNQVIVAQYDNPGGRDLPQVGEILATAQSDTPELVHNIQVCPATETELAAAAAAAPDASILLCVGPLGDASDTLWRSFGARRALVTIDTASTAARDRTDDAVRRLARLGVEPVGLVPVHRVQGSARAANFMTGPVEVGA